MLSNRAFHAKLGFPVGGVKFLLSYIVLFSLAGCGSLLSSDLTGNYPKATQLKSTGAISFDATTSQIMVVDVQKPMLFCIQPAPDAGFVSSRKSDVTAKAGEATINGQFDIEKDRAASEAEFIGRTNELLVVREMFYRLCELTANRGMSDEIMAELFKQTLNASSQIWMDRKNTTNNAVEKIDDW